MGTMVNLEFNYLLLNFITEILLKVINGTSEDLSQEYNCMSKRIYTNKNFKTQNSHFNINYCCPAYRSVLCESKDLEFSTIQINNEYNSSTFIDWVHCFLRCTVHDLKNLSFTCKSLIFIYNQIHQL